LLRTRVSSGVALFYATLERSNFTVRFVTNEPATEVDNEQLGNIGDLFEQACLRTLPLLAKLPRDKDIDAALEAHYAGPSRPRNLADDAARAELSKNRLV
jgi:hypothetical protein